MTGIEKKVRKSIEKAVRTFREWSPRGSVCPICEKNFRECRHTVVQARDRMLGDIATAGRV